MNTRERIISAVVTAFNEKGYHAFSLADLAQECNMSRGNLAYHYKYKEDILDDIAMKLDKEIKSFFEKRKDYPAFYNLSLDINTCRHLQKNYPFVFRDMSVLEHDSIKEVMTKWSKAVIKRNLESFAYGIEVGNLKPEPFDGVYYQLSVNTWMITYYWISQKAVREIGTSDEAEKMAWAVIIPHFTEQGLQAFFKYYGANYVKKLGIPIQKFIDLKHLI